MLPKEHGAYGQVGFPLVTSLILGGLAPAALLLSAAVVGGFLAHEPMQVLLGGRGVRARRDDRAAALGWGGLSLLVLVAGGATGVASMPSTIRWTVMWPVVPAACVLVAAARGREKGTLPEVLAAVAFSLTAIPLCLTAGLGAGVAAAVGVVYAVTFTLMTLAVRVVVLTMRAGGQPAAASAIRRSVLAIAGGTLLVTVGVSMAGAWPAAAPLALAPGLLAGCGLALWPPRATRLRRVGWVLVAVSCATMGLLLVTLA